MGNFLKDAAAFLRANRQRRNWSKFVRVMACIVVFVTTYALILPAITMETYTCGRSEHTHSLDCYEQVASVSKKQLSCPDEDPENHDHTKECYVTVEIPVDSDALTCDREEKDGHFHNDLCYGKWEFVCEKSEHTHTDACRPAKTEPAAAKEEAPVAATEPAETEPAVMEAAETEPAETEPAETEPVETEPAETEPVETEPAETEPVETEPVENEPVETEPVETEPVETEPVETEPVETEPVENEPVETEPVETEPVETEPVETEPVETEPVETEPVETEPTETQPVETEPTETEETVSEPVEQVYSDEEVIITVSYGADAGIPEYATLVVIPEETDSEAYRLHYEEALELIAAAQETTAEAATAEAEVTVTAEAETDLTGTSETAADEIPAAAAESETEPAAEAAAEESEPAQTTEPPTSEASVSSVKTTRNIAQLSVYDLYFLADGQKILPGEAVDVSIEFLKAEEDTPVSIIVYAEEESEILLDSTITAGEPIAFQAEQMTQYGIALLAEETAVPEMPEEQEKTEEPETPAIQELTYEDDSIVVNLTYGADAAVPEGAELVVVAVEADSEEYLQRYTEAQQLLGLAPQEAEGESSAEVPEEETGTGETLAEGSADLTAEEAASGEEPAAEAAQENTASESEPAPEVSETETEITTEEISKNLAQFSVYDISLLFEGEKIQPEAAVSVSIRLPNAAENSAVSLIEFGQDSSEILVSSVISEDAPLSFQTDELSLYGIGLIEDVSAAPAIRELTYEDDSVVVRVSYGPEAGIPADAELVVSAYTESYEEYYTQAQELLAEEKTEEGDALEIAEFYLYDISFLSDGQVIQPNDAVSVTIQFKNSDTATAGTPVSVIHFADEGAEVIESSDINEVNATTFQTDSFSPYAVSVMSRALPDVGEILAYFSFEDTASGFTYTNSSRTVTATANGNAGIATDAERGNVLALDGNGDFLNVTRGLLNGQNAITVSYWSKPKSGSSTNWTFYAAPNNTAPTYGSEDYLGLLEQNNYKLEHYLDGRDNTSRAIATTAAVAANKWTYVTAVFSNNRIAIYLDGVLAGSATGTLADLDDILGTNNILQIGKANWGTNGEFFNGYIDEYRIYASALSDADVAALYAYENSKAYQSTLLAHFTFDDLQTGFVDSTTGAVATGYSGTSQGAVSDTDYCHDSDFHFTGDDSLSVTNADGSSLLTGYEAFTVSYWSNPDSAAASNWGFYAASGNGSGYMGLLENGSITATSGSTSVSGGTVKAGKWQYVTAVYSQTGVKIYVNGELVSTESTETFPNPAELLGTGSILQIGKGADDYYQGYMDEYRIYGSALSDEDVAHLYRNEAARAIYIDATVFPLDFSSMQTGTEYMIYTQGSDGSYYALAAKPGDTTAYAVKLEYDAENNSFTLPIDSRDNFIWTFTAAGSGTYRIRSASGLYLYPYASGGSHGTLTTTASAATAAGIRVGGKLDGSFAVSSSGNYTGLSLDASESNSDRQITLISDSFTNVSAVDAASLRLASADYVNVWVDGTNGDLMAYVGSDNTLFQVVGGSFTLPEEWESPSKYDYVIRGWYNVVDSTYHEPGETVEITEDTVFYADWVPATYNHGFNNSHAVNTMDTSSFVTVDVFDYNTLFNVQSTNLSDYEISETGHREIWEAVQTGDVDYKDGRTLNFIFRDYDSNGNLSVPNNLHTHNVDGDVDSGIVGSIGSSSPALLDILFDPNVDVIGKNYVGRGNHLFQYVDATNELVSSQDNIGYYYYDSKYNAASYNQSQDRFYVYDYLEKTTDSGGTGDRTTYTDFLPFNSPYVVPAGQYVNTYTYSGSTNYEYDAKDVTKNSELDHVIANYNYGLKINIRFYLPSNSGAGSTNVSNNVAADGSTVSNDMVFGFEGDDDLWVYVDDKLVLDIGSIHGVRTGSIDFKTGTVTVTKGANGASVETHNYQFTQGDHNLTIYYLERGSSQSNCTIYYNLSPNRFGLNLNKVDHDDTTFVLPGTKFFVYMDEACTDPAALWASQEAANNEEHTIPESVGFTTDSDGHLNAWGFVLGQTYYLRELATTGGYTVSDDVIEFTLYRVGNEVHTVYTILPGANGLRDPGYEIVSKDVSLDTNVNTGRENVNLYLTVTNPKNHTKVSVEKVWNPSTITNAPDVTVKLLQNGVEYGDPLTLNAANEWSGSWDSLPRFNSTGNEYTYTVQEVVPVGFTATIEDITSLREDIRWSNVAVLEHAANYVLLNSNGDAMIVENGSLTTTTEAAAKENGYCWTSTHVGTGYTLSYGGYQLVINRNGGFALGQTGSILYYNNGDLYVVVEDELIDSPKIELLKHTVHHSLTYRITNTSYYELPNTGGMGTQLYTVSGLALLAAAAFLELNRRRKRA